MKDRHEAGNYELRSFEAHKGAKLDWPKVREIRRRRTESKFRLAQEFGVDESMIRKILNNKFWPIEKDPQHGIR